MDAHVSWHVNVIWLLCYKTNGGNSNKNSAYNVVSDICEEQKQEQQQQKKKIIMWKISPPLQIAFLLWLLVEKMKIAL